MTPEVALTRMLPAVELLLKAVVEQALGGETPATLYDLEALTQRVLPQIGQVVLQKLTQAQGSGLVGPTRPCACGEQQHYRDQGRSLVVQTSVGAIHLEQRAFYRCAVCHATSYPLDERLGLGQAGRMSRYLQEQCALAPGAAARTAGPADPGALWLAGGGAQPGAGKGEALGAEMDAREQQRLAALQAAAAQPQSAVSRASRRKALACTPHRTPCNYCTTEREPRRASWSGGNSKRPPSMRWRPRWDEAMSAPGGGGQEQPPLRRRVHAWATAPTPGWTLAPADQAVRMTYVARTEPYARFGEFLWKELTERDSARRCGPGGGGRRLVPSRPGGGARSCACPTCR